MSERPLEFSAAADHTFVASVGFTGEDAPSEVSIGLVVGTEAALLVDTGSTPDQGRLLRRAAAAATSVPLTIAVLTHWHYDHSFGLAGTGVANSIAHETVRDWLTGREAAAESERLGVDQQALALPTREVAVVAAIDLGGVRVEVVHLGRGHTDGDLVVVVPGPNVVFAGDLVESAGPPQYGPDSFPHEWPATLDGLIGLTTDRTMVIPGHGGAMDREAVYEQRGRIAAVSGEISRLAGLGIGVSEAEGRGDWALPFAAVRAGYEAGRAQARVADGQRGLPLV